MVLSPEHSETFDSTDDSQTQLVRAGSDIMQVNPYLETGCLN